MKLFKIIIILCLFFFNTTFCELYELYIHNKSSGFLAAQVFPVGCVFNHDHEYSLEAKRIIPGYPFIFGSKLYEDDEIGQGSFIAFESDCGSGQEGDPMDGLRGAIGFGKYRINFYDQNRDLITHCYVDYSHSDYPATVSHPDIKLYYYDGGIVLWNDSYELTNGYVCMIWDQRPIGGSYVPQNRSGFKSNIYWEGFPHDARNRGGVNHQTPEKLFVFLEILYAHIPYNRIPFVKCGKTYEVTDASRLNVFNGAKFEVGKECGGKLQINGGGLLWGTSSCSITVKPYSEFRFKRNSNCTLNNGNIYMLPQSRFCDEGANISGSQNIHFQGHILHCSDPTPDQSYFRDSVKIMLEDTATLNIPDSSTWVFEGNETALLCDSGSTIKFGKNSKLIFQDGARINAKHTKFTTYDSNTTWNGIYLSGVSYDTLQNCIIENALNGINIEDKYSLFTGAPATEISNCEFSNKTSEQLLNMVYVNNSANVMIRNCTSSSLINDGFASGVIIEYSTAGGVNVIDNEISYVTTAINVIQSSPYIARNTIIGAGSSATGIYLDNSNGTIECNIVDNFEKSTSLYYSSPYMLKNTFSNANTVCADVTAYSVPVMKPVASGTTLRWLGGNNYFTGQLGAAGITLESEGHPLMDSGYNVINVGNSYYMQGTISRVLYMRVNNWYDNPPESQKFDISGEEYDYSEYFDGYTIRPTDYYELNSIGFGYYDTVYVDELEGDNMSAEDIFILAYQKEMQRKFVEAVVLYKNVITNYKNSSYAVTSLSRIFNCLEKSNAGINQYSAVKSYYDQIKNSNTYPQRIREHAEDLAIKAKVRMGYIEEAISDYQTIINNNGNNPKGIHAQVNKLVLMNMNSGGDNLMIGNKQTSEKYKANLLSLITGKSIQVENRFASNVTRQFKLYQNYPNPFNPKTSIKYEIPKDAQATLTIYDLTGREILSITEYKQAGSYSYTFDGTNYASGLYFYKIQAGSFVETKKMVLIK